MRCDVMENKLSQDSIKFICLKKLDYVLNNQSTITYGKALDVISDLRDEIDRYC